MPDELVILLGANGDICSMLPWMQAESERTGKPVKLLVAKDYAPLLEGVSYVTPIIWPGTFVQLSAALQFLKSDLPDLPVKVLQPICRMEDRYFSSFVHEMWYQAGALAQFGKLPLIFDKRDEAREFQLVKKIEDGRPTILVAPNGRSSPFKHGKELLALVRKEFGKTHQIVDLSKVKAHRFYDLLGLYDLAAALVTVDTGHVHLSRASTVPTLVIARDYPQLWDGVPYEKRFDFYCRYAAWEKRKDEMIRALRGIVEGNSPLKTTVQHAPAGAYNPGVGRYLQTYRRHIPLSWKTVLYSDNGHPIKLPRQFNGYSHEDMRLFEHNGKQMASCVIAKKTKNCQHRCIMVYGEIKIKGDQWSLTNVKQPKYGNNNWRGMEKNWIFFSDGAGVFAIYGISKGRQIVVELSEGGKIVAEFFTKAPTWKYGEVRGGTTPLPHPSGHLIRFFHSRTKERGMLNFRYHIGALLMEDKPPFRIVKVTEHPIISGDEEWMAGIHHWKPNVVFPCGARRTWNNYILSYGKNDAQIINATIPLNIL